MRMKTFAERLNQALRAENMSQAELAGRVGVSQPAIWRLTSGQTNTSRKLVEIAHALNVSPEWLMHGEEQLNTERPISVSVKNVIDDNSYHIESLNIQSNTDSDVVNSTEFTESIKGITYTTEQANALFGNRPSQSVKVITVLGDGMSPSIEPGDLIFVDVSVNHFDGDGVYVFALKDQLYIKRLQSMYKKLAIISDNKRYETWYLDEKEDFSHIKIIAKVLLRLSSGHQRFA
ncbi:transcriptional regulator [Xenorhabdus vietnamensis]|uniref:Transcriptional regulator n=1 Tax=Xenorhabdus vietnamensis TaxID=351656 RepID=A0A1Y2S5X0_9GAMM|nr:S24 family peptidase [Xenorhabdus vietnamensis]OTA14046.1 transcriptional regulator [Xenorhabdus vietnamensis]